MATRETQKPGRSGSDACVQVAPRFFVYQSRPSSVPTSSSFGFVFEAAIVVIVPNG